MEVRCTVGDAPQRRYIARSVRHKSAVISDRVVSRAVVTVLRWLGVEGHAFSVAELEAAFAYLGLAPNERAWMASTERRLRLLLAGQTPSPN